MNIELRTQCKQILDQKQPTVSINKQNIKKNHIHKDVLLLNQCLQEANTQIQYKNKLIDVLLHNPSGAQIKQLYQSKINDLSQKVKILEQQKEKMNLQLLLSQQIQAQNQEEHLFTITYYQQKIYELRQSLINKQILINRFQKNSLYLGLGLFHNYEQVRFTHNQKYVRETLQIYEKNFIQTNNKIKQLQARLSKNQQHDKETIPTLMMKRKKQSKGCSINKTNEQKFVQKLKFNSPFKGNAKLQVKQSLNQSQDLTQFKFICFKTYKQNQQLKKLLFETQEQKLKYKIKSESLLKSYLLMEQSIKEMTQQILILRKDNQALKNIIMERKRQISIQKQKEQQNQRQKQNLNQKQKQNQHYEDDNQKCGFQKKNIKQLTKKIDVVQLLQKIQKVKQKQSLFIKQLNQKEISIVQQKSVIKAELQKSRLQFSKTIQLSKKRSIKSYNQIVQDQTSQFLDDQNISIINEKNDLVLQTQDMKLQCHKFQSKKKRNQPNNENKHEIKGNFNNILENFNFQ